MQLKKRHKKHSLKVLPRCWYCGNLLPKDTRTIDHVVPRSKNGTEEDSNRVLACKRCNNKKDSRSVEGFRRILMEERRGPVVFYGERASVDQ